MFTTASEPLLCESQNTQTVPESTFEQNPSTSPSYHTPPSTPRRRRLLAAPSATRASLRRTESTPSCTPPDPPEDEDEGDLDEFMSHSQPLPTISASPQLNRRRTFRTRRRRCPPEPGVDIRQIWADELELIEFMSNGHRSSGSSLYPKLNDVRERLQRQLSISQEEEPEKSQDTAKRRRVR
ncbi:uncharacterized protein DFL_007877 [Arthrobotrys flagrans]|uniref:Uncharacterized protein n=1 Tax=Arthrobotrys flagrans TaxID=97331 RepID=A0A436ZX01_ARTFL|nr:hypothetical protein DFL_007877 [Arthrobotrys flagrans]